VVDELFAGAGEAVFALFEGEQGGVANEDGSVSFGEHSVEVGGEGEKRDSGISPSVEEDAGVGDGGAGGDVGGDGAQGGQRLSSAADEEQGADAALGSDGAAGEDAEGGVGGEGGDGDEADVGLSGGKAGSAVGWGGAIYLVAAGEDGVERWVLEVPHEGSRVEKVDGGDAEAWWMGRAHLDSGYKSREEGRGRREKWVRKAA
jgi:hypothetical protein